VLPWEHEPVTLCKRWSALGQDAGMDEGTGCLGLLLLFSLHKPDA
jgi:hypothetical protein